MNASEIRTQGKLTPHTSSVLTEQKQTQKTRELQEKCVQACLGVLLRGVEVYDLALNALGFDVTTRRERQTAQCVLFYQRKTAAARK